MNISYTIQITHNRIPEIAARFPGAVKAVVAKTAHDVEADAKNFCPVDTGALRASIKAEIDGFSAEVAPDTEYAGYVELGTRKMAAQAYMRPAAEANEPKFVAAMEAILAGM